MALVLVMIVAIVSTGCIKNEKTKKTEMSSSQLEKKKPKHTLTITLQKQAREFLKIMKSKNVPFQIGKALGNRFIPI